MAEIHRTKLTSKHKNTCFFQLTQIPFVALCATQYQWNSISDGAIYKSDFFFFFYVLSNSKFHYKDEICMIVNCICSSRLLVFSSKCVNIRHVQSSQSDSFSEKNNFCFISLKFIFEKFTRKWCLKFLSFRNMKRYSKKY